MTFTKLLPVVCFAAFVGLALSATYNSSNGQLTVSNLPAGAHSIVVTGDCIPTVTKKVEHPAPQDTVIQLVPDISCDLKVTIYDSSGNELESVVVT